MAAKEKTNKRIIEAAVLASASKGENGNPKTQAALDMLLEDLAKEKQEERELAQRLQESRIEMAKEEMRRKNVEQEHCLHTKQNGTSRMGGQQLSDGTYYYLCTWCGKEYRYPLTEGAEEMPRHLWPNGDSIGTAVGLR